jgi:hypothetical protein
MLNYKVYLKKSGLSSSMDKLWDVIQVKAENDNELKKELDNLAKKGWKIFKVIKI